MQHPLILAALIIAVILYIALVRRRAVARGSSRTLAAQLAASNEVALGRIGEAARQRSEARASVSSSSATDRRSGGDRRAPERRRGRGRREGGERRADAPRKRPSSDPSISD